MALVHFCGLLDTFGDPPSVYCMLYPLNRQLIITKIRKMNQQTCRVYILLQYYPISSLAMGIALPYEEKQIRSWIFMVLFSLLMASAYVF